MTSKDFQVRYYENEMPAIGDVVMVKVEKMTDTSCYVRLLEYNNIEGMIPYTELSRRRIRSISQLAKVGRLQIAVVIRLDAEKKYIDLSKKQVTAEERRQCEERFRKSKTVASIMCYTAIETKIPVLDVMKAIAWPLYKSHGNAYDALKQAVQNPDQIFGPLKLDAALHEKIVSIVQIKLKAEVLKLQADVNVTCFTAEGVDAIRDVLLLGQAAGQREGSPIVTVNVQAPPTYAIHTTTEDKEAGVAMLQECIEVMKAEMARRGGQVEVREPPRVMGADGKAEEEKDKLDSDEEDADE
uniref:S1 motif domain-containing protein n=1 Tax=Neobodo designis TaxID=312471 RepID=A0A7S1R0L7_NEODS|mmetsp:Transcript_5959/g.18814  ORF Transcript_5959/g.18814 Transcript_5959/m.18814 type:complete len:298 (+) Transcript_5959:57-950(+)|eukprot:CAMPEP_0174851872 /NCGR_PEP_ID=MMETSP1114-20130205/24269_1 /TAXON_ID=312471 /ORGANISM="Neobodo designis, Strain CCAP 1951/1" /LENGTH=297 /DNA_ID=CAMNT_0016086437 /DNA_START=57 /DNA_END=950 /DNA_ORIENTATION=-